MKEWWINLSLREKQTLSVGAILVILLIFYSLIWSPLHAKVMLLRSNIEHQRELLAWMQTIDKKIQQLGSENKKPHTNSSLLSIIQTQINQSTLANHLSELKQAEHDSVQLSFQQVNFDTLIQWLTMINEQQGLVVLQITITPSSTPGMVAADFILQTT